MTGRLTMIVLTVPGIWWLGQYVQTVFAHITEVF